MNKHITNMTVTDYFQKHTREKKTKPRTKDNMRAFSDVAYRHSAAAAAAATQRQNRTLHAVKQVAITLATAQSTLSETSHKHAHAPQTKHITGIVRSCSGYGYDSTAIRRTFDVHSTAYVRSLG